MIILNSMHITLCVLLLLLGFASVAKPQSLAQVRPKSFLLVATIDGKLYALKDEGGTLLWQSSFSFPLLSSRNKLPPLSELEEFFSGEPAIIPFLDGRAASYSPHKGFVELEASIPHMVDQAPFMGESGTFISGSKSTTITLLDVETGSVLKLSGMHDKNKNSKKDTWPNITIPQNIQRTENNKGSFLLVVSTYKLNAVNLHSQKMVWNVAYSELLDVSDKGDSLAMGSDHLGYDLCLSEPNLLKAIPKAWNNDNWELKTDAPIMGVYQVIRGARLAKIRLYIEGEHKRSQTHFYIYDHNFTFFAADVFNSPLKDDRFQRIMVPLAQPRKLLELSEDIHKPHAFSKGFQKNPAFLLIGTTGVGTVIILCLLWLRFRFNKATTQEIAVGDENESFIETDKEKTVSNHGLTKKREEQKDLPSPTQKSTHKKHITGPKVRVGHLSIYTNHILGYGSLGTIVYKGKFEHRSVAVKRMLRPFHDVATKEISALIVSDNHPHVIRYYTKEEDNEFVYLALEKCHGSLEQLIDLVVTPAAKRSQNPKLAKMEKLFSEEELNDELLLSIIKDSLEGLGFLHSMNIVHRDLKPQNILISKFKRAKLSDMGLSRQLRQDEHSFETNASGSWGWQPVEVLRGEKRHSTIDVFSMGCIMYYTLTHGKHPFGDRYSRERNILQGKFDLSSLDQRYFEARHLIQMMIAYDHFQRPTVEQCLSHILFWNDEKRLSFLGDVVDNIECDILAKQHNSVLAKGIEITAKEFGLLNHCDGGWDNLLDKRIVRDAFKHRKKYDYFSVGDLLRLIRNKKNHFRELPPEIQQQFGDNASGCLKYFTIRFPRLMTVLYVFAQRFLQVENRIGSTYFGTKTDS